MRPLASAPEDQPYLPPHTNLRDRQRDQLAARNLRLGAASREQGDTHVRRHCALDALEELFSGDVTLLAHHARRRVLERLEQEDVGVERIARVVADEDEIVGPW